MARLPDIQYRGLPQAPLGPGPELAVSEARQRQQMAGTAFNAAAKVTEDVATRMGEDDAIEASAKHQQTLMNYQEFAAANPVATRQQLRDFAINNNLDVEAVESIDASRFEARGEEALPSHVWYADVMEEVMRTSLEQNSERIAIPAYRREWYNATQEATQDAVGSARIRAGKMEAEYEYERTAAETEFAINNGSLEEAKTLLQKSVWQQNPVAKKVMDRKLRLAEHEYEVDARLLAASSSDDYDAIVEDIMDPEWSSGISADDQLRLLQSVTSMRSSQLTADKKAAQARQDAVAIESLARLTSGEIGVAELNELARQGALSKADHRALINEAQSLGGADGVEAVANGLQLDINSLEFGLYDGEYDDAVMRIQRRILDAAYEGQIDRATQRQLVTDLNRAKDSVYTSEGFKYATKQAKNLILGSDNPYAAVPVAQRQKLFSAMRDLRTWAENNGGASADVEQWVSNRLPRFVDEAAKEVMLNISDEISSFVQYTDAGGQFKVDVRATETLLREKMRELNDVNRDLSEMEDSERKKMQREIDGIKEAILGFETWMSRYGEQYGTQ